jgi:hypothetical protein
MNIEIKELNELYTIRPITEKHLSFEEWNKLCVLRSKRDEERKSKKESIHYSNGFHTKLKVGDFCTIYELVNNKKQKISGLIKKYINKL